MPKPTLLLSQEQIKGLITMKEVVEAVEKTFKGMGDGTVVNPTKVLLDLGETAEYPPYKGFMNAMPAYIGWLDSAGIKWAGGFLGERKQMGLPYITSLIMLIDPKIGNFRAVLDGEYVTNLRTGSQTAVALKYLWKKPEIKVSLYGAGMQGRTHTMAISELFKITEIRVYDVNPETLKSYAEQMRKYVAGSIVLAKTPEEASGGDVAICVTQSKDKFFKYEWFKPGTILVPIGSYQECDDDCILNADHIIVDHIGQTLHRGALGNLVEKGKISEKNIYGTIGEVIAGKKPLPDANKRLLTILIGTGALDVAVATIAYNKAVEKGIGGTYEFV
ncbi:MAG: ornithine cyclodeaminase family protein [Synergistaceae bacterium]|jgi:ornithine cyclodeaminase/alanine dehydrogenase|nr:ornithine cyclodeaminase family protein [Synergistaceae bacterium]